MKLTRSKNDPIFRTLERRAFNHKRFTNQFYINVSRRFNSGSKSHTNPLSNEAGTMGTLLRGR